MIEVAGFLAVAFAVGCTMVGVLALTAWVFDRLFSRSNRLNGAFDLDKMTVDGRPVQEVFVKRGGEWVKVWERDADDQ